MVKGISRRVVLIKSPDPKVFDEAIFIVREETARNPGVTCDSLLREAQDVAERFVRSKKDLPFRRHIPPWVFTLAGAAATGLVWLATALLL